MVLIPNIDNAGNLSLDAYSFDAGEFSALIETLSKEKIPTEVISMSNDSINRKGIRVIIQKMNVNRVQKTLNVTFKKSGDQTDIIFNPTKLHFDGSQEQPFRCSRIDTPPHACETIYANNRIEAIIKCALLAGKKNWLGGVPAPGSC